MIGKKWEGGNLLTVRVQKGRPNSWVDKMTAVHKTNLVYTQGEDNFLRGQLGEYKEGCAYNWRATSPGGGAAKP